MVTDGSIQVLVERLNTVIDDIKEVKGKVDSIHVVTTRLAALEKDVASADRKAEVALSKTDRIDESITKLRDEELTPIKTEIGGNRKAWRWVMSITGALFAAAGALYSQWHPWQDDIGRAKAARDAELKQYSQDVGKELQRDDNRLSVLEFRVGSLESDTKTKGGK